MQKNLSVVISVLNQLPMAKACYRETFKNCVDLDGTEFIIIDNGSDKPILESDFPYAKIIRNETNIGVYPTFKQGMESASSDIVAFFHSDVVVWENAWDLRVVSTFNSKPSLGLIGFIGSNEIDSNGGRGGGTASNFQGDVLIDGDKRWSGSPAEAHGKRMTDYMRGAVVDGCVMIIRKATWEKIGYRENFPPHHFYDRLISTQVLESGYHVGVLGVGFDHISGQTVNQEKDYHTMAFNYLKKWSPNLYAEFDSSRNYDTDIYSLAERIWLNEYRESKHLIPITIYG